MANFQVQKVEIMNVLQSLRSNSALHSLVLVASFAAILSSCSQTPPIPNAKPLAVQAVLANGTYEMVNVNSGKVMSVFNAATVNGTRLHQWTNAGAADQKWKFEDTGDGSYKIINAFSNKAMDVSGGSAGNGVALQLWDYGGGANQRFTLTDVGDGAYSIKAVHSGKAVEIGGFSKDDGGVAQQWDFVGADSQKWRLVKVSGTPDPILTLPPVVDIQTVIYDDALSTGWQDWSWNSAVNLGATSPVQSGSEAISVSLGAWGGLSLRAPQAVALSNLESLNFAVFGAAGGSRLRVSFYTEDSSGATPFVEVNAAAGVWTPIVIPLNAFGEPGSGQKPALMKRINITDATGQAQGSIGIDDLKFVGRVITPNPTPVPQPVPAPTPIVSASDLRAALAQGGRSITLPAGSYDLGQVNIAPNTTLIGAGSSTVLNASLESTDASNITISNLAFRGNPSLEMAIDFNAAKNLKLSNLDIQNYHSSGITLKAVTDSVISDISIAKSTRYIYNSSGGLAIDGYTSGLRIGTSTNVLFKNVTVDASGGGKPITSLGGRNTVYKDVVFDGLKLTTTGGFNAPWCCGGENITTSPQISMELWGVVGNVTVKNSTFVGGAVSLAGEINKTAWTFNGNWVQCTEAYQYGVEVYGDLNGNNNTFSGPCYAAYASFGDPGTITTSGDRFTTNSGVRVNGDNSFSRIEIR